MKRMIVLLSLLLIACSASATLSPAAAPTPVPAPPQVVYVEREPVDSGLSFGLFVMIFVMLVIVSATFYIIGSIGRRPTEDPNRNVYFKGMPEHGLLTEDEAFRILRQQGYTIQAAAYLIEQAKNQTDVKQLTGRK